MNKIYRYLRIVIAVIAAALTILAFAGLFYPIKIFDIQLTALLQRFLIDFSLSAGILLAGLLLQFRQGKRREGFRGFGGQLFFAVFFAGCQCRPLFVMPTCGFFQCGACFD